ncbi:hypothetical protein BO79DRAFT_72547 [Aspergillus costaricaensis CBS 115574]|uniref:Uncharacterized protein n=1 Tax=Aspergillus costaricaensis CBS 115574 TaxID=1448317 RepID=A0ACD1I0F6_9EURO|nr:hypothetical protein BO79DRAFT_72547 [Aspergillus costaricaensis CBS 115574]RAK83273.1 hypothetical protein BO79DRAFT_72547 [Aspergillus costaricaensis CBS 115574]
MLPLFPLSLHPQTFPSPVIRRCNPTVTFGAKDNDARNASPAERTHKGDAGQCTALSIHVGANKYLTTGEEGTYAERSNIKERTALCESVVAGAQVISHHYAITDHEQKQGIKQKIKTYPSKRVYYRRGISHHSLNQSFERR